MEKYVVGFFDCEELDTIKGKDVPAIMYTGVICNTESGNSAEFDLVPLTGEIAFYDEWESENDEFYDCGDIIRESARKANKRAYYIGTDGVPFIAEEINDGMYTYSKYWRLFNTVKGYWIESDADYMINAQMADLNEFMHAMIGYSFRQNK